MADTTKITKPSDLWPLPWDDMEPTITQEEQDELQSLMVAENARLEAERNAGQTTAPEASSAG